MCLENHQWKVMDCGLETQFGQVEHAIPAAGLFDTCVCDDEMYLAALIDNMGRDRVIRDKFLDIYPKALAHHAVRLKRPVDDALLARSLASSRENDSWLKAHYRLPQVHLARHVHVPLAIRAQVT